MTDDTRPRVHLYMVDPLLWPERVLCRAKDATHVTEYGPQVTCPACRAIMRGLEPEDDQ